METSAIRFYTVREAAAILKVHERTVLRWIKGGRIAARRIGRRIRIEEDALRYCGEPVGVEQETRDRTPKDPRSARAAGPRKGSPQALLECAGMLTKEDAEMLRQSLREADEEELEALLEVQRRRRDSEQNLRGHGTWSRTRGGHS